MVMKEKKYCVYRHRKISNGEVFYVGISNNKDKRPYDEIHRSDFWKSVTEKHGRSVEIIAENLSKEDACELESFLIEIYGRKDLGLGPLVNLTNGGEGGNGCIASEKTRLKQSKSYTYSVSRILGSKEKMVKEL
jgi:hypothetical protein